MDKKEVAKLLRKKLKEAIEGLPNVEYDKVTLFTDTTFAGERDHDVNNNLHKIELIAQESEVK